MAQTPLVLGTADNDGTGDPLKTSLTKIEANFTDLYGSLAAKAPLASPTFTGVPAVPTAAPGTNTTQASSTAFVAAAIAALVASSPATLDTLKELADALGGDPNFATTVATALGLKAPLASPALTGNPTAPTQSVGNNSTRLATTAFLAGEIGQSLQAHDADLDAFAALVSAANKLAYYTGSGAMALADLTAFARTILAATDGPAVAKLIGGSYVIGKSAIAAPLTGTTAETTLATIAIPANALGPNGEIEIYLFGSAGANNANVKTFRVKFGATTYVSTTVTSALVTRANAVIANRNATNSQVGFPTLNGAVTGTGAPITSAEDTTASVNITITGQLASSGDTMTLETYLIRVTHGA